MPRMAPGFTDPGAVPKEPRQQQSLTGSATPAPPRQNQGPAGAGGVGTGTGIAPAQMPDAIPSFNTRKANAASLYGPGGSGWENFGLTGGPGVQGPGQVRPPVPAQQRPMQMGAQNIARPMGPPPVPQTRPPQMGPGMGPGLGPPQQGDPFSGAQPGQMDFIRQIFSNPGFMQMLQQYMSRQQPQRGPVAGGLPPAGGGPVY